MLDSGPFPVGESVQVSFVSMHGGLSYEWPDSRAGVVLKHRTCSAMRARLGCKAWRQVQHTPLLLESVALAARRNGADMWAEDSGEHQAPTQKFGDHRPCQDGGPQLVHAPGGQLDVGHLS